MILSIVFHSLGLRNWRIVLGISLAIPIVVTYIEIGSIDLNQTVNAIKSGGNSANQGIGQRSDGGNSANQGIGQ